MRAHASPPFVCDSIRSTPAERSPSRCHRERCTPVAARRLSAKAETASVDLVRSAVLGRFVWGLAQLALPAALRAGRHRRPVAAGAFSQVLGAAVQGEPPAPWQTRDCGRDSPAHRRNGRVQSAVACATASRRTQDAWHRDL